MLASAIVDIAEARFGDSDNSTYTAAEWLEYVNDAILEFSTSHPDWPFLLVDNTTVSVTAGQGDSASLGSDVWRVRAVFNDTDNLPLAPLPGQADYRHYFPDPTNGLGIPLYYKHKSTAAGTTVLEVYPYPSSTTSLKVDYISAPVVVASNAEPNVPEQYQRLLVLGALARAYEDDGNLEQANHYDGRFQRGIARAMQDLLAPRSEGFPQIVDTF